jgi:PleD family two-component response regulator
VLWQQQRFQIEGDTLSGLSFSAGICDSQRAPLSPQMLLQSADQQLLAAKQHGRSRVLGPGMIESAS